MRPGADARDEQRAKFQHVAVSARRVSHPLTKAAAMLRSAGGHDTSGPPSRGERPIGHAITMRPRASRQGGAVQHLDGTEPKPALRPCTPREKRWWGCEGQS